MPFLSFIEPTFAWNVPLASHFLEEISSSPFYCFPLFLCFDHWGRLSYLFLLFFGTVHWNGYIFPFLLCFFFWQDLAFKYSRVEYKSAEFSGNRLKPLEILTEEFGLDVTYNQLIVDFWQEDPWWKQHWCTKLIWQGISWEIGYRRAYIQHLYNDLCSHSLKRKKEGRDKSEIPIEALVTDWGSKDWASLKVTPKLEVGLL